MKLIYVVNQRLPIEKAYGLQIAKMAEAFAGLGLEVELVAPRRKDPIKKSIFEYFGVKKNFKVTTVSSLDFYLPGKLDILAVNFKSFLSAIQLFLFSVSKKHDLIYSRDELPLYFLSFFKKNLVFEAHRFSEKRKFFYRRFKNMSLKTVVISKGLGNEFLRFGFKPQNVLVAHDGVDLEEFNVDLNKDQARLKLGLSEKRKLVGYVGQLRTLGMEKGIDLAIKSLKSLPDDVNLVLVGGDKKGLDLYKELSAKEGLKDRVLFAGQIKHDLIPLYLKSFDVLLMPFPDIKHYAFYMSPLKLFEYMASKRPIVATDLPSVREILNEKNSVLVQPESPESLAGGVKLLQGDQNLAESLANQAFQDVKDHTWQKRAEKILEFVK